MQEESSKFKIPASDFPGMQIFDTSEDTYEVFYELNQIAEELESCRLRNCS